MTPSCFRSAGALAPAGAILVATIVALGPAAADVSAQMRPQPARPYRGLFGGGQPSPDPNRTRTELTLMAGVTAGYDDNIAGTEGPGSIELADVDQSGYAGLAQVGLTFFHGKAARSISADVQANGGYYSTGVNNLLEPGVAASVAASTTAGRRNTLGARYGVSSQPQFAFGTFAGLAPDVGPDALPTSDPVFGLVDRRTLTWSAGASLQRQWSRRDTMSVDYAFNVQEFTGDVSAGGRNHSTAVRHERTLSRWASVRGSYGYRWGRFSDFGGRNRPTREHAIEGGPSFSRRLSATRQLTLGFQFGATYVESERVDDGERYQYWTPSGGASVALSLGQTWSTGANYSRRLNVLDGLTGQSYFTDSVTASLGGLLGRRVSLSLSAGYANGRTSAASGRDSTYSNYTGGVGVGIALSRHVQAVVDYYYYTYRYSNPGDLPPGFPARYDRNAVRIGISTWIPLIGTYAR